MPSRTARRALRHDRAPLCVRWLVLLLMMLGTVVSSVGDITSHGIAAMTAGLHAAAATLDGSIAHEHARGHVHEECNTASATLSLAGAADHAHHGADHSHDKGHVPPNAWRFVPPQWAGGLGRAQPWAATVQASRLERPPRG